jgi:hypothetical protein
MNIPESPDDARSWVDEALEQGKGWSDEERQAYIDELMNDEKGELPMLAERIEDMDPALVEALVLRADTAAAARAAAALHAADGRPRARVALASGARRRRVATHGKRRRVGFL